tara:strand:- start:160 stop:633 length:474 start_codon:yes stop_codon:yes gene_type:complete
MEYSKAYDNIQNKLLNDMSRGPGLYIMDESIKTNKPAYPWAPGTNSSRAEYGVSNDLIDIESDINNLTRPLTKDISKEYSPESNITQRSIYGKGDYFNSIHTKLNNPPFDLKEYGINRWEYLQIDPQANAIEPFKRIGVNTILETLDTHTQCPQPTL